MIENGYNASTGADREKIIEIEQLFFHKNSDYAIKLNGEGDAEKKIVKELIEGK